MAPVAGRGGDQMARKYLLEGAPSFGAEVAAALAIQLSRDVLSQRSQRLPLRLPSVREPAC